MHGHADTAHPADTHTIGFSTKMYLRPSVMDVALSTLSANGQIVIPADIRRRLGLGAGTKVLIIEEGGSLVLKPLGREVLEEEFASVLARLHRAFEEAGVARSDVEAEIEDHRSGTA